jgi:hypothetical protein
VAITTFAECQDPWSVSTVYPPGHRSTEVTVTILGALTLTGLAPGAASWGVVLQLATSIGITGFIAGGGFSLVLGTEYRHHRLEDMQVGGVAIKGAVISVLLAPLVSFAAIGLGGSGVSLGLLAANVIGSALLGGLTAAGTVVLAQRSAPRLEAGLSLEDRELSAASQATQGE